MYMDTKALAEGFILSTVAIFFSILLTLMLIGYLGG
jgi:phage-related holin